MSSCSNILRLIVLKFSHPLVNILGLQKTFSATKDTVQILPVLCPEENRRVVWGTFSLGRLLLYQKIHLSSWSWSGKEGRNSRRAWPSIWILPGINSRVRRRYFSGLRPNEPPPRGSKQFVPVISWKSFEGGILNPPFKNTNRGQSIRCGRENVSENPGKR